MRLSSAPFVPGGCLFQAGFRGGRRRRRAAPPRPRARTPPGAVPRVPRGGVVGKRARRREEESGRDRSRRYRVAFGGALEREPRRFSSSDGSRHLEASGDDARRRFLRRPGGRERRRPRVARHTAHPMRGRPRDYARAEQRERRARTEARRRARIVGCSFFSDSDAADSADAADAAPLRDRLAKRAAEARRNDATPKRAHVSISP